MIRSRFALAIAAAVVALPLQAQTITFNTITPTWTNIQPSNVSNLSIDNSGGTTGLSWGSTSRNGDQSEFRFSDRSTPLAITLSGGSARFNLGTFRHINNEIGGNALSSAYLNFLFGINGSTPATFTQTFQINHDETSNGGSCPFGTSSQNRDGCADRVTVGGAVSSTTFMLNSQQYMISLLGFSSSSSSYMGNGSLVTAEGDENTGYLWAEISTVNQNVVPEPSTYALMATGLAGLVGVARRRRAVKA